MWYIIEHLVSIINYLPRPLDSAKGYPVLFQMNASCLAHPHVYEKEHSLQNEMSLAGSVEELAIISSLYNDGSMKASKHTAKVIS